MWLHASNNKTGGIKHLQIQIYSQLLHLNQTKETHFLYGGAIKGESLWPTSNKEGE